MKVQELLDELSNFDDDADVFIEINGNVCEIYSVTDDSQGVYVVADEVLEEKELRP